MAKQVVSALMAIWVLRPVRDWNIQGVQSDNNSSDSLLPADRGTMPFI